MLRVEDFQAELLVVPTRLFRRGEPPMGFSPDADLSFLCSIQAPG